MFKKIFTILLAVALCLASVTVFADGKGSTKKRTGKTEVVTSSDVQDVQDEQDTDDNEENDVDENDEDEQDAEDDSEDVSGKDEDDQDEDVSDEDDQEEEEDEDEDDNDKVPVEVKNNGKSKVIKEQLKAKKQERAAARLEAKVYIKDLHKMFKGADKQTKKEILSEIAAIKKELKDYSIGVFVRGLVVDFEKYDNVEPVIEENRVLAPIRAIVETLGANVSWDGETGAITITKGDVTIVLNIDSEVAIVNGEEVTLDVAPKIIKDRTLVPMRFISETLNLGVEWDDDSKTVVVDDETDENENEEEDDTKTEGTETKDSATEDDAVEDDAAEDDTAEDDTVEE